MQNKYVIGLVFITLVFTIGCNIYEQPTGNVAVIENPQSVFPQPIASQLSVDSNLHAPIH